MTEPTPKRADQLVVGDRIPDEHLAFRFNQGPASVVFVAYEDTQPLPWTFVAYRYPNGQHDSMTIRPEAVLRVYLADSGLVDETEVRRAVKLIRCGCGLEHGPQCPEGH